VITLAHTNTAHRLSFTGFHNELQTCGPDVTAATQKTLSEIESTFGSWSFLKKAWACVHLVQLPWAASAWDVYKLMDLGVSEYAFLFNLPAIQGNGVCKQRVAYNGKCYQSGAVNYVAYGRMCRLCNDKFPVGAAIVGIPLASNVWSLPATLARVGIWKIVGYKGAGLTEALDFTQAGWVRGSPKSGGCTECTVVRENVTGDSEFDWLWEPYRPLH
jgi:hypothetical protein